MSIDKPCGLVTLVLACGTLLMPGCARASSITLQVCAGDAGAILRAIQDGLPASDRNRRVALRVDEIEVEFPDMPATLIDRMLFEAAGKAERICLFLQEAVKPFDSLWAVEIEGEVLLRDFSRNFVQAGNGIGVYGQTLWPLKFPLEAETIYALGPRFEVFLAQDQSPRELAITVFHELAHVAYGKESQAIRDVEDEARRNTMN